MPLKDWFARKRNAFKQSRFQEAQPQTQSVAAETLSDADYQALWQQCPQCSQRVTKKEWLANASVCPQCQYHGRLGAKRRIAQLTDAFDEIDSVLVPGDPLNFTDTQPYVERQQEAKEKSKLNEAIVTGLATIAQQRCALGVMDFAYMGGSMGSVVGEKITRLAEKALEAHLPLVIISSSGGARMQEGTLSLMQMVKTGAVLGRLHEAGLLYISVLTEPTFGGVTASYGTLGDVILAEEGARIGFAGRRVIEQTIRQKLPADFQTAGYLLKYGQVDSVVHRHAMKDTLAMLLRLHQCAPKQAQAVASAVLRETVGGAV